MGMRVETYEDNRDDDPIISIDFDAPFIQGGACGIYGSYPVGDLSIC